jgi:hypothetical protein
LLYWFGMYHLFFCYFLGKAARPRCFKHIDMAKLHVTWYSNRTACINSKIFTEWLNELDLMVQKQKRNILLFLDNAPVHLPDVQLKNVTLKFSLIIQLLKYNH